jgi:hypothetical protein
MGNKVSIPEIEGAPCGLETALFVGVTEKLCPNARHSSNVTKKKALARVRFARNRPHKQVRLAKEHPERDNLR